MPKPLCIFLHSDGYDRIYQAVNMIATAASTGRTCYLFLFYHALGSFMAGAWDEMGLTPSAGRRGEVPTDAPDWHRTLDRSFDLANLPSLYDVLERARQGDGEVLVYACSNSMQYLGLEPGDVSRRVDAIAGLATMLEVSSGDREILYL